MHSGECDKVEFNTVDFVEVDRVALAPYTQ